MHIYPSLKVEAKSVPQRRYFILNSQSFSEISREVDNAIIHFDLHPLAGQQASIWAGGLHRLQGGRLPPRGVQHHRQQRRGYQRRRMSSENCIFLSENIQKFAKTFDSEMCL